MKSAFPPTTHELLSILENASTIAVVGCSALPNRVSYKNSAYLQQLGYKIIPVNPKYDRILGETCYADLGDVPDSVIIDIVNVFRRPSDTESTVLSVINRIERTSEKPVIWTQLGVSTEGARLAAEKAGLVYVSNRCLMVEHSRLF